MFELKTRAFSLTGNTITEAVEKWMRMRTVTADYGDLLILSIDNIESGLSIEPVSPVAKEMQEAFGAAPALFIEETN